MLPAVAGDESDESDEAEEGEGVEVQRRKRSALTLEVKQRLYSIFSTTAAASPGDFAAVHATQEAMKALDVKERTRTRLVADFKKFAKENPGADFFAVDGRSSNAGTPKPHVQGKFPEWGRDALLIMLEEESGLTLAHMRAWINTEILRLIVKEKQEGARQADR